MQKKLELSRKMVTGEQSLEKRLEGLNPVILKISSSCGVVKIVSRLEVDPNDDEAKKEAQNKKYEELKKIKTNSY